MRHECNKLFHDQLRALVDYLDYEYLDANICIKYIGNDEGERDMHLVRTFPFNCDFPMLIVYWNGIDMYYEEINDDPELFDYNPKKSLKDECLKLVDDAVNRIDQMLVVSGGNDMLSGIKLCLENLSTNLNKIKDNT